MGSGAVSTLGLIALGSFVPRMGRIFAGSRECSARRMRVALCVATALPIALFGSVQIAKFGSLTIRPSQQQANIGSEWFEQYEAGKTATPSFRPGSFSRT